MILVVEVFLLFFTLYYIVFRLNRALAGGYLGGFLLNPMLYFLLFGILYLLVADILIGAGAYNVLMTGLPSDVYELTNSRVYVILYFVLMFVFYIFMRDLKCFKFKPINYKSSNEFFFVFLVVCIFVLIMFICLKHARDLLSLRSDRAIVYDYFANQIYNHYKLGVLVNLYSGLLVVLLLSKKKFSRLVVLLPFFGFFALDYLQGGRSIIIRLVVIIYLCVAIYNNKIYLRSILLSVLFVAFFPVMSRFAEGDSLHSLFIAFGEFIYTRLTVDYVIYYNFKGEPVYVLYNYLLSIFPGVISRALLGDSQSYINMISNVSGLSFGLAGSIVAESVFYFGRFCFFSIPLVFLTSKLFYLRRTITRLPFLIGLIVFISNIQNIYRTSFFDFGLVIFYLMLSYLLIFTFLLWNKKIA